MTHRVTCYVAEIELETSQTVCAQGPSSGAGEPALFHLTVQRAIEYIDVCWVQTHIFNSPFVQLRSPGQRARRCWSALSACTVYMPEGI